MFQRHHRDYINKSATFNMSVTYKLRQRMDVSGGRGVGKTKFKKKLLKSRCTTPRSWSNCLVLCKASARFVWGAYENQCGICGSYSWRVRQIFQEKKKELTSYWMILSLKHQRALKLLNCLHVVAMAIFLRLSYAKFVP